MQLDEFAVADVVIVAVIAVSALFGLMRGFVREVVALAIWSAAAILSLAFGPPFGQLVAENLDDRLQTALGIGAVFVVILVAGALLQRALHSLIQGTGLSGTDRTLGLVFGGVRGVAVVVLGLIVLRSFSAESSWWQASQLVEPLLTLEDDVLAIARAIKETFYNLIGGDELVGGETPVEITLPLDPAEVI